MEIAAPSFLERLSKMFLKEPVPFATKREVNWKAVKIAGFVIVLVAVVVLLLLPTSQPEQTIYYESADSGSMPPSVTELTPSETTLRQFEQSRAGVGTVPRNLDYLYGRTSGGSSSPGAGRDRSASMIVVRGGLDSKMQVPPGSRIRVKLLQSATVAGTSIPVIGTVASDYIHEDGLAIPRGSKVYGEVSFDEGSGRAQFSWRSLQMPDGRERQLSAISVDRDGQVGVQGKLHSEGLKNTLGQTLTRFISSYAEGSMQRGGLGGNPGGNDNGWKNAIADTAKDRSEAWAEDLKKEKKWIELRVGTEFFVVLKEPFTFRDPGGTF